MRDFVTKAYNVRLRDYRPLLLDGCCAVTQRCLPCTLLSNCSLENPAYSTIRDKYRTSFSYESCWRWSVMFTELVGHKQSHFGQRKRTAALRTEC